MNVEWKEIKIRLDSRIASDLTASLNLRGMCGQGGQLEAVMYKILLAIEKGESDIQLRYKSNDPNYRAG